jgi:hypothetical protein
MGCGSADPKEQSSATLARQQARNLRQRTLGADLIRKAEPRVP